MDNVCKQIFDEIGLSYTRNSKYAINTNVINWEIRRKLLDQFYQKLFLRYGKLLTGYYIYLYFG